jgi:DNA-binding SARP family transcriptional activator
VRAEALHGESLKLYQSVRYRLGIMEALEALALVWERQGQRRRAARLLAVVVGQREQIGAPALMTDRRRIADARARLRPAFGEQAGARIQAEASSVSLEQAAAEALGSGVPESSASAAQEPELRVFALGPTRVIAGARVVPAADWTYAKAKELLFYLLAQPPATKAQIGLDLWPEASPEQLRNIFHRALHCLRQALGHPEWIVFRDGAYTLKPDIAMWCDLHIFEAQTQEARALLGSGMPPAARRAQTIACLEAAAALWRGDFLADMAPGEWALLRGEALRQAFLRALLDLGQLHMADAQYPAAAAIYERAIAFDNYVESAHRELMRCHARQGEVGHALREYQRLRQLLRDELGADPSPETTLLYERLRRGDDI